MKKILIIESNPDFMKTARAVFSDLDEYEFLFSDNFTDAESLIDKVDALLVSAQVQFSRDTKVSFDPTTMDQAALEKKSAIQFGSILLIKAGMASKPAIKIGDNEGRIRFVSFCPNESNIVSAIERFLSCPSEDTLFEVTCSKGVHLKSHAGIDGSKRESSAWLAAWQHLLEKINEN